MADRICSFRGKYGFLSNMTTAVFEWDGRTYRNSEAAFQSAKSLDPKERDCFCELTGVVAKRAGRKVNLRSDWEAVKVSIMEDVVREKFLQNPELLKKLLDTGDAELIEGNGWHDTFWGVDQNTGEGENHLGRILMRLREELGGEDYLQKARQMREEKQKEADAERAAAVAALADVRKQLETLPEYDFSGKEMNTRAFGRVVIKRHEGEYLTFDSKAGEKTFALPNCMLQGFLIPDDPEVLQVLKKRSALQKELAELEKALIKLGS